MKMFKMFVGMVVLSVMTGNLLTINACNQDDNEKQVIETENKQQGVGAKNEGISVISGEAETG